MSPAVWEWAARYGVSAEAVHALRLVFALNGNPATPQPMEGLRSEAYTQSACRLAAARAGIIAFRNNVGAMQDESGRVVRFGLANDSKQMNERLKSADLIGVKPGGQFWCREMKPEGWHYTGAGREPAQLAWIELITSMGGDAAFSTGGI